MTSSVIVKDERNSKAMSIQNLKEKSQMQLQSESHFTELTQSVSEPESKTVNASEYNISENGPLKKTHATVDDSFACHLEPDTSGPHILLHHEAREEHLEFLLWALIWQSEDDVMKVHLNQLK
ncbi:uncharacterized protein PADG_12177 [Paracoccidioides brasiliensis Pb18]|uniref:Uncharacterized protein n=2 Tax=Paracoccidioides brasiliensis TaxID=121759 RepID=A0A0A0HRD6_PARBD|nr:uncharacterized protein PADG_12177 [Paracoccidioides brasiliensis Pb18]KGM91719.1 hypothetical protein PADG_12177 [Paracoccidioides brasiliensis Pb18]ODH38656.1 hypothetical protein ACO22_02223 [Paracoccidioides brasiliensis]